MYCASDATLAANGMRKANIWGGRDSGTRMWNAPNDDINKVLESNIATYGEKPCPWVVRFS
ncbi:unnamed protein product [Tuber melanosporum]|uniref:(Perigord truffle) hypothetical protein n=1 Tax=Tuber melanosporum (strain Mel28) TaxID=656061 RepID=D5GCP3_TUBMM|nr:uncharacterized protein GSTUM_00005934001 [Tuber melanosporum]CAZ82286.1 unnamed protein product [Tuber melanosporum]